MGRCRAGGGRRGRGGQKRGLQKAFDAEVTAEVEAFLGPGILDGLDFEAIERQARQRALAVAARIVEQHLNADRSDRAQASLPCPRCDQPARYAGRRQKTFTTALGLMALERAYYHCPACAGGFCPRDLALGLEETPLSPAVTRMVGKVAASVSFAEGEELLDELAGVRVDAKQVERYGETLGAEIAEDERTVVEPAPPSTPTMYMGLDGTGAPMRPEELQGRKGKQDDGSAKTREVKVAVIWSAEGRDPEGLPVRDPGSVSYSAAIDSAAMRDTDAQCSPCAQRIEREGLRRGFDQAPHHVLLGDGARWIWNFADEIYPRALQIVDLFHAKQRLYDAAKDIYGAGTDLADRWARNRWDELDAGRLSRLVHALRDPAARHPKARDCLGYIVRNRRRMRYPTFRAQGLCVSTGVVEAGCKVVVGTRLKRAGMRWTLDGANAILALRAAQLSGRFDDFWKRRSAAKRAAVAGAS